MNILPAILKKRKNRNGKVNIKIRIIHNRQVRDIGTEFYIDPVFWTSSGKVSDKYENAGYLNYELSKVILEYEAKLLKINFRELPISRVVALLRAKTEIVVDFSGYFKKVVEEKRRVNKRTGQIYEETRTKIENYDKKPLLMFEDITAGWLRKFEVHMREKQNSVATISLHLRNIRSVFNCAIDDGIAPLGIFPFRRYKIPKGASNRVPLTLDQLKRLISLRFENEAEERARLAFLLSFVMIGINNSDVYELPSDAIVDGRVDFSRNKTSKDYSIKIEPEITEYIGLLKGSTALVNFADHYKHPRAFTKFINKKLKNVGKEIGYPDLIMYIARHTWASLCKNELGTDDNDISAALGHTVKGVTQTYVHRNRKLVDEMNRKVLDLVFKEKPG